MTEAPTKTRKPKPTKLETLEADRAQLAEQIAQLRVKKSTGDVSARDDVNKVLPAKIRELKNLDNELREATRDARDAELQTRQTELQPDDNRLHELCEQLQFQVDLLNQTCTAVRDAAVALGVKVDARHSHPLSPASIEHALRIYLLGRLEVRLQGAGDVPHDVQLPFRGAFLRRCA